MVLHWAQPLQDLTHEWLHTNVQFPKGKIVGIVTILTYIVTSQMLQLFSMLDHVQCTVQITSGIFNM